MLSPSTLLVGFDPRTGFAVARCLHRSGIRVIAATVTDWEVPVPSAAIATFVQLPSRQASPTEFIAELGRLIEHHAIDTILPLTDRALLLLSPHLGYLKSRLQIACPTPEQLELILEKSATAELAAQLDLPRPQIFEIENPGDSIHSARYPLFAKLRDKSYQDRLATPHDPVVYKVETPKELKTLFTRYGSKNLLLQEHIPGDDVGLAVLMHEGEALATFQYRAIRVFPADGGVSVATISEDVDPAMKACALKILRALDWSGIAQLDFRKDCASGRFAFIEVNGRFWGSTAAAISAGMPLPLYAHRLLHGILPQIPKDYRIGQRVRWLEGDVRRLLELAASTGSARGEWNLWKETFHLLADFRPGVKGMIWSWSDPRPSFELVRAHTVSWAISKLRRFFGREKHPVHKRRLPSHSCPPFLIEADKK